MTARQTHTLAVAPSPVAQGLTPQLLQILKLVLKLICDQKG